MATGWMLRSNPASRVPQTSQMIPLSSSGSPKIQTSPVVGTLNRVERLTPMNSTGIATRNPAIGPAMPMSNSSRLLGMGCRMRMKAPRVPANNGAGRK